MEEFYNQLGFETKLRVGKYNGEMQAFDPPLEWEDFRDREIIFRIVEVVKGQTNITFGHGNRGIFDHIGVLVNETEYRQIIDKAKKEKLRINEGDRRTFISTPWKFRIELQRRKDVVTDKDHTIIHTMDIGLPFDVNPEFLASLLDLKIIQQDDSHVKMGNERWNINFYNEKHTRLNSVYFSKDEFHTVDPVGIKLIGTMDLGKCMILESDVIVTQKVNVHILGGI
ncbi:hypothetical protein [Halobacillus dabanensis]|nr:hypothetical protein [Halobacillus dabanensis]